MVNCPEDTITVQLTVQRTHNYSMVNCPEDTITVQLTVQKTHNYSTSVCTSHFSNWLTYIRVEIGEL